MRKNLLLVPVLICSLIQFSCSDSSSSRTLKNGRCWSSDMITVAEEGSFQKVSFTKQTDQTALEPGAYSYDGAEMSYIKIVRLADSTSKRDRVQRLYFVDQTKEQQDASGSEKSTRPVCVSEINSGESIGPFEVQGVSSFDVNEDGVALAGSMLNFKIGFDGDRLIHSSGISSSEKSNVTDFYKGSDFILVQDSDNKEIIELRQRISDAKGYDLFLKIRYKKN